MPVLSNKSKELIREYAEKNQLPEIGFKLNSSMHDISQSFFSAMVDHEGAALESFDGMQETPIGKDAIMELDLIAEKMANKINSALGEIRAVTEESRALIQDADGLFKQIAAKDPVMNKFLNMENEKIDFKFHNWDALLPYCSESSLVFQVNSAYSMDNASAINLDSIPFHVNQLPFIAAGDKSVYNSLAECKEFNAWLDTLQCDKAQEMGQILTNEREGKRFLGSVIHVLNPVMGSVYNASLDVVGSFFGYFEAFGKIRDGLTEEISGFGAKEYEQLQDNMMHVQKYLDLLAYLTIGQRRTIYQDAYILPNGKLNPDNHEARMEAGISDTSVNNNMKYYEEILGHVPSGGVSVERLKQEMDSIDKRVTEQLASAKFDSEARMKHYRADAMRTFLQTKIVEARQKNIRGWNETQLQALLKQGLDQFIVGQKTDIDMVTDFLMGLYHPYQMSERLYKAFKQAYLKSLPDYGQVTNTDLKMIETKVIAKTVADFAKKAFC